MNHASLASLLESASESGSREELADACRAILALLPTLPNTEPAQGRKPVMWQDIRWSTDRQDDGCSKEVQLEAGRTYWERHLKKDGILYDEKCLITEDGESAYKKALFSRPGFLKIVAQAKRGDHIYFYRMDRAVRRFFDIGRLIQWAEAHGIELHFGNMPYMAGLPKLMRDLMRSLLAWAAEQFSEMLSGRMKDVHAYRRKNRLCGPNKQPPLHARVGRKGERRNVINTGAGLPVPEMEDFAHAVPLLLALVPTRKVAAFLEQRRCEREGIDFLDEAFGRTHKSGEKWLWSNQRVAHAWAIWQGLQEAGVDTEAQQEILGALRSVLMARYPIPNRRARESSHA